MKSDYALSVSARRPRWLRRLLIRTGTEITEILCFQNQLCGDGRCILAAVETDARPRAFEQHSHGDYRFVQRRETQIPGVATQLVIEDGLFMLADDLALEIFFDHDFLLGFAGFWIDNRNRFLSRAGLATAANAGSFHRHHR